ALHEAIRPYTSRSRMNIALCYALLAEQPGGWALHTVGAGAVAPLVRRASGAIEWLPTAGLPLGTVATPQYREVETTLVAGDLLLLLSDGIVEAMSANRELFGFDRLGHILARVDPAHGAHATLTTVIEAVRRHSAAVEQQDDITLVVVRVLAGAVDRR